MELFSIVDQRDSAEYRAGELVDRYWRARMAKGLPYYEGDGTPQHWLDGLPDDDEDPVMSVLYDVERTVQRARSHAANQDSTFHAILAQADADPTVWAGPDPTVDPLWEPPKHMSVAMYREQRRNHAVRAAAADIAVRVHMSEGQVRTRAHRAFVLKTRSPQVWHAYECGNVSEQNAATVAELAATLPDDDPQAWCAFDDGVHEAAASTTPGKFRTRARAVRERVHKESLAERHQRSVADRFVELTPLLDGMAMLTAILPATTAIAIERRLDETARHLRAQDDETRTLAQLRADVFGDLLTVDPTSDCVAANGSHIGATVRITIPVLTLLGRSDEPATLDGYGPIDLDTAKDLASGARSWIRVLTHPVTGTVMDVDRRAYKVPADLRRLVGIRHATCVHPGCQRPSDRCEIDHTIRWADGGTTSADNLAPLCGPHHKIKDETLWGLVRDPDTGVLRWTSPTGFVCDADPPPF